MSVAEFNASTPAAAIQTADDQIAVFVGSDLMVTETRGDRIAGAHSWETERAPDDEQGSPALIGAVVCSLTSPFTRTPVKPSSKEPLNQIGGKIGGRGIRQRQQQGRRMRPGLYSA